MREKLDRLGINGAKMIKLYQFSSAWELPNPTATSVDAIVYSFLAKCLVPPLQSPLKDHGLSLPNLWAYCERMKKKYYET
jgi:hypothetical protein